MEEQGRVLIEQAIEQPLDPQRLATGVLNALGDALKIPQDVRDGIERDLEQQKRTLAE